MFVLRILVLLVLAASVGCDGSSKGTLNGTVTWNGEPLADGLVNFIPEDGKSPTASAIIKDGKFSVELPATKMKVQFSAPKVVGKKKAYDTPDSPTVDIVDELLPLKYTTQSTLTVTVKGGTQDEKFDLVK